ncbi:MAG: hypothetical protein PHC43_09450 [Candidatus Marinimicrobia bacterium]|jgi:hypothetical protein|nr:hypothetical protein [Candidatus Neomarinimicrobiota bacterium]
MTWSYSGDPSISRLDALRFLSGDTSSGNPMVTDEEIIYTSTGTPNNYMAAAQICRAIATKFSFQVDTNNAGLSISASQRAKAFSDRAKDLEKKAGKSAGIYIGGRLVQEKKDAESDITIKQPAFSIGMDDYNTDTMNSTSF